MLTDGISLANNAQKCCMLHAASAVHTLLRAVCVSLRVVAQPVKPLISYVQTDATTPPGQQCCVRLHWTKTTINNLTGWAPTQCPETNRNISHWVLLFISWGAHKNWNNTYSYTNNECSGSKIPKISHCFNLHDSSLDRHVNDASCKSLLYDKTTEKPFEIKIWINISF